MSVHSQVDAPLSQITTKSIAQIPCRTWNLPFQHAKIMGLAHLTKLTSVSVIHDVETSLEVPTFFGIKLSFPPIFWYDFCPPLPNYTDRHIPGCEGIRPSMSPSGWLLFSQHRETRGHLCGSQRSTPSAFLKSIQQNSASSKEMPTVLDRCFLRWWAHCIDLLIGNSCN